MGHLITAIVVSLTVFLTYHSASTDHDFTAPGVVAAIGIMLWLLYRNTPSQPK